MEISNIYFGWLIYVLELIWFVVLVSFPVAVIGTFFDSKEYRPIAFWTMGFIICVWASFSGFAVAIILLGIEQLYTNLF